MKMGRGGGRVRVYLVLIHASDWLDLKEKAEPWCTAYNGCIMMNAG